MRKRRRNKKAKRGDNLGIAKVDRTKVVHQWFGKFLALCESKRGTKFVSLSMAIPGKTPGSIDPTSKRLVPLHKLRLPILRQATIDAVAVAEKGELTQTELESVLDYLFAELNSRLNKGSE